MSDIESESEDNLEYEIFKNEGYPNCDRCVHHYYYRDGSNCRADELIKCNNSDCGSLICDNGFCIETWNYCKKCNYLCCPEHTVEDKQYVQYCTNCTLICDICENSQCVDSSFKCVECFEIICEYCDYVSNKEYYHDRKCKSINMDISICRNCITEIDMTHIDYSYSACKACERYTKYVIYIQRWWKNIYYHPDNNLAKKLSKNFIKYTKK